MHSPSLRLSFIPLALPNSCNQLLVVAVEMAKQIAVCVLEGKVKGTIRFEQTVSVVGALGCLSCYFGDLLPLAGRWADQGDCDSNWADPRKTWFPHP